MEMMGYHLIKSGSSPLGLMFDSFSYREYAEIDENVLTSRCTTDEKSINGTLCAKSLKEETISDTNGNKDAETEIPLLLVNIYKAYQAIETVCHFLLRTN